MHTKKALVLLTSVLVVLGLTGLRPAVSRARSHPKGVTGSGNRAAAQITSPKITKATIAKKDLIVEGENFAAGASILFNGTRLLKAKNDDVTPSTKLIVKKGRNSLPEDEVVSVQVKNPDGLVSEGIGFFTGLTITYHNTQDGGGISLRVGQIFLLSFDDPDIGWNIYYAVRLGEVIGEISYRVPQLPNAQGLFFAKQSGLAAFRMEGVTSGRPPFLWLVNLDVQ